MILQDSGPLRTEAAPEATGSAPDAQRKPNAADGKPAGISDSPTQKLLYGAFELTTLERKKVQVSCP
jgi:hypothetical protein